MRSTDHACFFVITDAGFLEHNTSVKVKTIDRPEDARAVFREALPVLHTPLEHEVQPGVPDAANAKWVIASIDRAARLALDGVVDAMVTNPIQKETLYSAGFAHQGHTDYLAALARQAGKPCEPVMMMSAGNLRTVPVSVHIPLAEVPRAITTGAITSQAMIVAESLKKQFGIERPAMAVTGLNPHAGEGGAMGREEIDEIIPAVTELVSKGLNVTGPLPADTVFHEAARAQFDVIICMYHDQALIPVKELDFFRGVNTTLGLPFIRTSPDHGTALALAGVRRANPSSLIAAIEQAAAMARHEGARH